MAIGLVLLVASRAGHGQRLPDTADPGQLLRRFEERIEPQVRPPVRIPEAPPTEAPAEAADVTFTLTGITLDGVSVYPEADLARLWQDELGEEVSLATIYEIAERITTRYRNDGYILSRAVVPPQEIAAGVVRIRVLEGYVDDVVIEGELQGRPSLVRARAERIRASRPLRAADLERYLLLLNELPGLAVEGVLRPADTPGAADLVLVTAHDPFIGAAQLDNRGTRFNGPVQLEASATLNSVLGLYEATQLRGVVTPDVVEELRLVSLEHTEPLTVEGLTLALFAAYVETEPGDSLEPFDVEGRSFSAGFSFSYPFVLRRSERLFGEVSFDYLNSETDAAGLELVDDRIRAIRVALTYDVADAQGGINVVRVEVSQGLDVLDASERGVDPQSRAEGESEFTKIALDGARVQALGAGFSVRAAARGQYSFDPLLAPEEFDFGGEDFGRAYDPFVISGDHGLAGQLELRYGRLIGDPFLQSVQLFASYDAGITWRRDETTGDDREFAHSVSTGIRLAIAEAVSASFEVGLPLNRPSEASPDPGDDEEVVGFFRISAVF